MKFSVLSLPVLAVACLSVPHQFVAAVTGAPAFYQEGYPTIAVIAIFIALILSIVGGARKSGGGYSGFRTSILFTLFNIYMWICGLFLIFGPEGANSRPDVLGLQLALLACMGFYATLVGLPILFLAYSIFAFLTALSLIGSMDWLNYKTPIWYLDTNGCNGDFNNGAGNNLDRCNDTGYLQFLRVMGASVIPFVAMAAVQALTYYGEGGLGVRALPQAGGFRTGEPIMGGQGAVHENRQLNVQPQYNGSMSAAQPLPTYTSTA